MTANGWKYFDFNNLNEFFSIKYAELLEAGMLNEQKLSMTQSAADAQNMSMSLNHELYTS